MKIKKLILFLILFLIPKNILANENINIYVFHNYNCKYCQQALKYFNNLIEKDNSIHLFDYELLEENHAYNRTIYNKVVSLLNINKQSVPLIIIGNEYIIGFSPSIKEEIEKKIINCKTTTYNDKIGYNIGIVDKNNNYLANDLKTKRYYINTIFGKLNISNYSLFLNTFIIGLIDGINLYYLIGIAILIIITNIKDKRNAWILFLTYIGCYTFVQFVNIMAWFNNNDFLNNLSFLKTTIISFTVILASINLYFYIKKINCNYPKFKKLFIPITGTIILSIIMGLFYTLNNNNQSLLLVEILNDNKLIGNNYMRYIIFYLLFFNIVNIAIFLLFNFLINKKQLTKAKKYSLLIKSIILYIISLIILFF